MQWLIKCCARAALSLTAAALLLAGVPVHAGAGAPRAAGLDAQPLLLVQASTQQQEDAEKLEKQRQEELKKKAEQQQQQLKQPQAAPKMRTRGAIPQAAPEAEAPKPGGKRFGAGVVRGKEDGEE